MVKKESLFDIENCVLICLSHAKLLLAFYSNIYIFIPEII